MSPRLARRNRKALRKLTENTPRIDSARTAWKEIGSTATVAADDDERHQRPATGGGDDQDCDQTDVDD
jgi:hypothetical protein